MGARNFALGSLYAKINRVPNLFQTHLSPHGRVATRGEYDPSGSLGLNCSGSASEFG
jgi:hypothetical protein